MLTRLVIPTLLLALSNGCESLDKDIDSYLDAYAERGESTCMCVWDIVRPAYESQDACFEFFEVSDEGRDCVHMTLDDDDHAAEILGCRVDAERAQASCLGALCNMSKEAKAEGAGDCKDSYDNMLMACEALKASTKEEIMDCLAD